MSAEVIMELLLEVAEEAADDADEPAEDAVVELAPDDALAELQTT